MFVTKMKRRRTTGLPPPRGSYKGGPLALLQYEHYFVGTMQSKNRLLITIVS